MSVPIWTPGDEIAPLADCLDRGGVLAIPTESSYGLAADPCSRRGCEAVLAIKGRSRSKALPLVVPDAAAARTLTSSPDDPGLARVAAMWPAA